MGVMLGNLNLHEIQNRLGVNFSEQDIKILNEIRCEKAKVEQGKWHCFDIPFIIVCGGMETRNKVIDILTPYASDFKTQIQIASE